MHSAGGSRPHSVASDRTACGSAPVRPLPSIRSTSAGTASGATPSARRKRPSDSLGGAGAPAEKPRRSA
ncbi:hypothetical protein G3I70_15665 [Actinomadura bangladeshensis]|uniref:Uncharacterized protein n=1 Tax=Actinomadura bangladeshensis TaxID=453573 RepID=A0A6L9QIN3_9ACTN|nr:hypothetical protein [Actinomadura bangladeshensis]